MYVMFLWTKVIRHSFGAPTPRLFVAKYSAEKSKDINLSQPPHQGDELKDAKLMPNGC